MKDEYYLEDEKEWLEIFPDYFTGKKREKFYTEITQLGYKIYYCDADFDYFKNNQNGRTECYFYYYIKITRDRYNLPFKIQWDILYIGYRVKYFLSRILEEKPEFVNKRILDLKNKIPLQFEVNEIDFTLLKTLEKELENITLYLDNSIKENGIFRL
ncbi:hypothetical protein [Cyanobacterium sp. Dongsha4]|uniref:hypothetical protein n=1 Tax=Cyanobacterium sp. DS4 TaxID=2878255 RepID=UPI002E823E16|nr:hypothetical protein [Cyanobacterium sp. Dongsha4]WVL02545.1 hypothetical protein Dongsha4_18830 [Cyanobacterium sp. Dongsha4]